jgi:threonine synthase
MYYSTNLNADKVSFKDALLKGLAPDRGLYMPEVIPSVSFDEIREFSKMQYHEIAFHLGKKFLSGEIPEDDLEKITKDAYDFDIPLENAYERKYVMRLDQGPTASFKDFAARMMGRLMQYFLEKENREILILTATSGDTGSAIANAFYGLDNIKVVVLYPEKEISDRQRKQMTTLQDNIQIVALNGKFDDCQAMVKKAFADPDLAHLKLSSANSINVGRLIPQSFYYFYGFAKLWDQSEKDQVIYSVPSGNFGNLMGGLIAKHMGLPVKRFVVGTNENDEVPVYFDTEKYNLIVPSINCISNAMNVGHPSNMSRIIALYGGIMNEKGEIITDPDLLKMKTEMFAISINDQDTKKMIKTAYKKHNLVLEPHGAVSWASLMRYLDHNKEADKPEQLCISLETAHPAKFPEQIQELLDIDPWIPKSLENALESPESADNLNNEYPLFKEYLTNKYSD